MKWNLTCYFRLHRWKTTYQIVYLVAELCHYFVVDRVRTQIEMFKEGLSTLGILECIKRYPTAFRKLFCHSEKELTSDDIDRTFVPQFDAPGSNSRAKQELAVVHWRDYLQDCAGKVDIYCTLIIQYQNEYVTFC